MKRPEASRGDVVGFNDDRAPRAKARKKPNPLAVVDFKVTYKDELLKYFVSERGRILPRRMNGVTSKQQRMIARAVKQARGLGLLPYLRTQG